mmetsp:Transcript_86993/g.219511  ORF Transcript_86993/g.219511 Transcript_86993/m.219511 type:complete len:96 (+) Transcript_86993:1251-1538(+)
MTMVSSDAGQQAEGPAAPLGNCKPIGVALRQSERLLTTLPRAAMIVRSDFGIAPHVNCSQRLPITGSLWLIFLLMKAVRTWSIQEARTSWWSLMI